MIFVLLSTPTCAFIPKYHCFPFRVWCISGSRLCSRFLVELGAWIRVASTIVPVVIRTPFACKCRFTVPRISSPQMVLFQQVPELAHRRLIRHRRAAQITPHKLPQGRRVVQSLFHRRVRQIEPLLQKINPQHLFQFFRPSPVARLGIVRLDQRTQFPPRHHLLHLFQEHCPPSLLRVPLESCHHRQCPLPTERVHAGTTLSIRPVEREDLIRVSLGTISVPKRQSVIRTPKLLTFL